MCHLVFQKHKWLQPHPLALVLWLLLLGLLQPRRLHQPKHLLQPLHQQVALHLLLRELPTHAMELVEATQIVTQGFIATTDIVETHLVQPKQTVPVPPPPHPAQPQQLSLNLEPAGQQ